MTMQSALIDAAQGVAEILKARKQTLAVAESSSGGLISAALLAVPGASAYFLGGAVVYTGKARMSLMGLPREAVAGMRSSSEPYALLLARTARENMGATWGLSETGAAGPTGNPYGDAAGHSCLAVSGPVETAFTLETGQSDRAANMDAFALAALKLLAGVLDR
jgi:nicotinamide-nucleotide amidase